MKKLAPREFAQLIAGIEQANSEIISALASRYSSKNITSGSGAEDRVKSAIRVHRAAIAMIWVPAPESSISAAKPRRDDGQEASP